jgi:hypothetical protein
MKPLRTLILLAAICLSTILPGQKTKFNFAQSYLGLQTDYLAGPSATIPDAGALHLILGGTHFWYRADFYISIPLYSRSLGKSDTRYSEGFITGARYLPWGPGRKYPRPFAGLQWLTPRFHRNEGPFLHRSRLGLEGGLSMVLARRYTMEASVHYVLNNQTHYPLDRLSASAITLPDVGISIGLKRYFDFTAGNGTPQGKAYITETTRKFDTIGALSGRELALGLSTNCPLQPFAFTDGYDFLTANTKGRLIPELAVGYYFHKADLGLRLAYRPLHLSQSAYGLDWRLREHRLGLEAFKFLFDYHGFVPFIGLGAGATYSCLAMKDGPLVLEAAGWRPDAYLTFGWDIRPSPIDWFILRTNLRYLPAWPHRIEGAKMSVPSLEVNFIQFVFYPKRFKNK